MSFLNPPGIDEPLKIKNYLKSYKDYIFSKDIITDKFKYLSYVNSIFPNVRPDVQSVIYDGIFSIARDLNPAIRERAMRILSETAPIPKKWVCDTLSKGEEQLELIGKTDTNSSTPSYSNHGKKPNIKGAIFNKPYIGTVGMCLEDPHPEVRSSAIIALVKSVTKSDDEHAKEVMTAITQLTNDASPIVRTAAIKGLYKTSTIVGDLVQLEDSQLRLILPIIVDKDSHQNDRIEVLKFIGRLSVTSYDQMTKVSLDLSEASDKCDWGILLLTAYTFGRHNYFFARIFSSDKFETLWASYFEFSYPARKVLILMIIVLGGFDEERFPLQLMIQQIGSIFTPLLMLLRRQYEKNMSISEENEEINLNVAHSADSKNINSEENDQNDTQKAESSQILLNEDVIVNGAVDLEFLKSVVQGNELLLREILALNDILKDSCDLVLQKDSKAVFKNEEITVTYNNDNGSITSTNIPQSPSALSTQSLAIQTVIKNKVVKYRGQITLPQQNTKFNPISYKPQGNFIISICGKVTPYPKDAILLLLMKIPMNRPNYFTVEMKPDGSFLFQPSINLPPFSPFFKIELILSLQFDNIEDTSESTKDDGNENDETNIENNEDNNENSNENNIEKNNNNKKTPILSQPFPIMDKPHELWFKMSS